MSALPSRLTHPKYRADIDGLRAVAVLSVVTFHAAPSLLPGGFVGVDIFFVISGFLISTIVFDNLEKNRFSFVEFYARRVKRIFPALFLVLTACFAFGWLVLLADEYKQLGKHIAAGAGFVSNFVLWGESGYFDNAAETKPLLHLWSLGVEEQFYIFWPVLVWLAWKSRIRLITVTMAVLLLSFALNIYAVNTDVVAAFYLPFTRFWELTAGSLLAYLYCYGHLNESKFSPAVANTVSFIGSILIVSAVFLTTKEKAFPGWWALLPVLGSICLIVAGSASWINREILASRVAVWFGLISYPLYLWHWPLLSFGSIAEGHTPSPYFRSAAVLLAIILAWVTFRFLENEVRSSGSYKYVSSLVVAVLAVGLAGLVVFTNDGVGGRKAVTQGDLNEGVRKQFVGPLWAYTKNKECLKSYSYEKAKEYSWWFCMKSDEREPTLLILGNSFANQLYPGFIKNSDLAHHTVLSIGTCDVAKPGKFEGNPKWPCYGNRPDEQRVFIDDIVRDTRSLKFAIIAGIRRKTDVEYINRLRDRINFLEKQGIQVVIFTPHMKPNFHPKACFSTPLRNKEKDCSFSSSKRNVVSAQFDKIVKEISRSNPKVRFFDQNDMFCNGDHCSYVKNGMPLHRDKWHLSEYGSIYLQKYFTAWARKNMPDMLSPNHVNRIGR
jgi:peptidoglycan/LPS O-acetylase OafA/YrhL